MWRCKRHHPTPPESAELASAKTGSGAGHLALGFGFGWSLVPPAPIVARQPTFKVATRPNQGRPSRLRHRNSAPLQQHMLVAFSFNSELC